MNELLLVQQITNVLLMFIPCGNSRFKRHRHYSFPKPHVCLYIPRVFENLSRAVQCPTKTRRFHTPELYLQNKANYQSQGSSGLSHLQPEAKGVQFVFNTPYMI